MSLESQARQRIDHCKRNIEHIDSQIRDLLRIRDRDRGTIAALELVLSPIRTLPSELLVEIFHQALRATVFMYPQWEAPVKDILALTQVCAYWRRVAQTTPRIWVRSCPVGVAGKLSLEATKIFLDRSHPLPIPVQMPDLPNIERKPFLNEILRAAQRWRTFMSPMSLLALVEIPAGGLEALESVELTGQATMGTMATFVSAPRLRTVVMNTKPHILPMPWFQLTNLELQGNNSCQRCLDILVLCTNLLTVNLNMVASGLQSAMPSAANPDPTTLPYLEDFEIYLELYSEGLHLEPFFHRLRLPVLKTLRLGFRDELESSLQWFPSTFTQFQLRSPHIEHLQLSCCNITSIALQTVLRHGVGLKYLNLECCHHCIDNDLFVALQYRPTDSFHLAPRLEQLSLSANVSTIEEEKIEAMIASRWWTDGQLLTMPTPAISRLKRVDCVDNGQTFTARFIDAMENYRSEGLELEFWPQEDEDD